MSEIVKNLRLGGNAWKEKAGGVNSACQVLFDAADEIEQLRIEIARLLKGEYICQRCGLRKNSEHPITHQF